MKDKTVAYRVALYFILNINYLYADSCSDDFMSLYIECVDKYEREEEKKKALQEAKRKEALERKILQALQEANRREYKNRCLNDLESRLEDLIEDTIQLRRSIYKPEFAFNKEERERIYESFILLKDRHINLYREYECAFCGVDGFHIERVKTLRNKFSDLRRMILDSMKLTS